jgi:hypothetical protein
MAFRPPQIVFLGVFDFFMIEVETTDFGLRHHGIHRKHGISIQASALEFHSDLRSQVSGFVFH